ncbi:MAG: hypothetical protein JOY71_23840, partial [Acetobacteraceae bacterium]|nr:hypothetical protein [Acetobacteraceae bacterium]
LTEGWDCQTVTHIVGLRPFQSQLLCEQVVGRALRRRSYEPQDDGRFPEEVAKVFGVPFEVVPFKATNATPKPKPPQHRIHAVEEKKQYAITIPRVLGYAVGVRNRITVPDWDAVASITLDPMRVPPGAQVAAALNMNRPSIHAPGGVHDASLQAFRAKHRVQQLAFQMARDLTRVYLRQATCEAPAHVLFPQVLGIVRRYIEEKVKPSPPAEPSLPPITAGSSSAWPPQFSPTPVQARPQRSRNSTGSALAPPRTSAYSPARMSAR